MKYKPYPKYKESGVAWLGKVPEGWIVAGFKKYFENIVDYRGKTPEKVDNGIFLVTARNIKSGKINYNLSSEYVKVEDYNNIMSRGKPEISDVLFTTEAPLGEVANIDNINIALAQRVIKFRGKKNILDNYYLKYFMMSSNFQSSLMIFATGSTALGIKAERLVYLRQLIPSLKEQKSIANYLDQKTQKIDILIEKQQTLIKLLKEKRQAVISHAVTKGLDDSVEMKDSGVTWLGDVPLDWKISKLRFIFSFNKGLTITKANLREKGIPCVNYGEIHSKYGFEVSADKHELKCVDPEYLTTSKSSLLSKGDFVFADTSEDIEGAGNFTHLSGETQIFAGYHTIIARQIYKHDFRFLAYLIDSEAFRMQVRLSVKGVKVFSVTQLILKNCIVWLPEVEEQKNIAQYLDQKTNQIDTLISKSTQAIELLKERRTALISAVVTGKVDVRDA